MIAMTETIETPPRCCDACTCDNPHRSTPVEEDNTPEVNVQES
jgi:hypothetical protein